MRNSPVRSGAANAPRRFSYHRRATLEICGPDCRRPGGRLFLELCALADRFIACRDDPWANRLGLVLFHAAYQSSRAEDGEDFRLPLRSSIDLLIEIDPIERWQIAARASPEGAAPDGQRKHVLYPTFADFDLRLHRRAL